MASFDGLGRALRWTRQRQGKKQYEVAERARVTKAMLSSYENEKQRPTIDTLERILDALDIDVDYLAYAIRSVRAEGEGPAGAPRRVPLDAGPPLDVERLLGLRRRLEPEEERAAAQMLDGFHSLLRYMLRREDDELPHASPRASAPDTGPEAPETG
ncbi:MAG: helix-turn-helix transcriptional regulator [Acidobacteriota bacterium]|jgi:transcriptional regulator with XRE-family HTH domain